MNIKNKSQIKVFMRYFSITILLFIGVISQVRFLISETDSLPQHYFLHFPHVKVRHGNYTVINSQWYGGKIIKKVLGVAGDRIFYDFQKRLWVGKYLVGGLQLEATDHRRLTRIAPQTIPAGKVFVGGIHERSFDSRYKELDLIEVKDLGGMVVPLW